MQLDISDSTVEKTPPVRVAFWYSGAARCARIRVWIPAFAGMTISNGLLYPATRVFGLAAQFLELGDDLLEGGDQPGEVLLLERVGR